eukprot:TRINITY_DN6872_c0_g1_i1.p1 TRINITY_DN6872_c0_g1~~TRINITY_DN6872_c0_g1_i1.p1  ORF type:complete len:263 (+),score=73.72 TRINITY_DN6872_c0_g1_i1:117-905(+)
MARSTASNDESDERAQQRGALRTHSTSDPKVSPEGAGPTRSIANGNSEGKVQNSSSSPSKPSGKAESTSSQGGLVQAIRAFRPEDPKHLELKLGDLLVLTHPECDGMFRGKNIQTERSGWFPFDAVEMYSQASNLQPEMAPEKAKAEKILRTTSNLQPERAPEEAASSPRPEKAPEKAASSPRPEKAPEKAEDALAREDPGWVKYKDPNSSRIWYWNEHSEECFFAESAGASGWQAFKQEEQVDAKLWWWHEETLRLFFDPS